MKNVFEFVNEKAKGEFYIDRQLSIELREELEKAEEEPDIMIACAGGGSNLAGSLFPFIKDKIKRDDFRFIYTTIIINKFKFASFI